jgi:FkbM family methyltransferase
LSYLIDATRRVRGAARVGERIQKVRDRHLSSRLAGPKLIRAFADVFPAAVFVEIGANDGEQHDHLRPMILERHWHGVMVEPVPYVFERLRTNYAGLDRVVVENAAIADRDGHEPFYHLAPVADYETEGLPQWYDGIGSFSRDSVLDHQRLIPDIESRLVETEVPCLTFDSLCDKHALDHVDLLLVDTEGYDYEVLRNIDLEHHRPALVIYEHYHLSEGDQASCQNELRGAGYETMSEGFDTWCLRPEADAGLYRQWRRLHPAVPALSERDEPR